MCKITTKDLEIVITICSSHDVSNLSMPSSFGPGSIASRYRGRQPTQDAPQTSPPRCGINGSPLSVSDAWVAIRRVWLRALWLGLI